jgi:LCP family protein required for cell wall assembly
MVLHASLTSFRKLSIPRDTLAEIPDCGTQKINASLACNTNSPDGNIASTITTVSDFLGIDIHHVLIIDFDGFSDLINTLGGVKVDIPDNKNVSQLCKRRDVVIAGDVDGGKDQGGISLGLPAGETTLEGDKALALARLRQNICDPGEDDTDRAARQQLILNGIKSRLTSITRLPYNFVKGPWIGWNMPKAFISDMGGFTLPQLGIAAIFGGAGETNVLGKETATSGDGGSLVVSDSECRDAVEELTGGEPDREPACSP